jgi:hypothetical protein
LSSFRQIPQSLSITLLFFSVARLRWPKVKGGSLLILPARVPPRRVLLKFAVAFTAPLQEYKILRFLVQAAIRMPKLTIAIALGVLVALAGTLTYTGFLVVGVLADLLDISRFFAGLLLGILFARIPRLRKGKLSTVGLLPKFLRRPVMVSLLALCLVRFMSEGDHVAAGFMGFATFFLLAFPWLKRAVSARIASSLFQFPGRRHRPEKSDDKVIDVEFREKND